MIARKFLFAVTFAAIFFAWFACSTARILRETYPSQVQVVKLCESLDALNGNGNKRTALETQVEATTRSHRTCDRPEFFA